MLVLAVNVLTNAAMWSIIVGFISPLAIQFITNATANRQVQAVLAFAFCLAVAVPTAYFAGDLTLIDWVRSSMLVFISAMAAYEHFWKPTGVTPSTTTTTTTTAHRR